MLKKINFKQERWLRFIRTRKKEKLINVVSNFLFLSLNKKL